MSISFNVPCIIGSEGKYLRKVIRNRKLCGDGFFTKKASELLAEITKSNKVLLTTSCSHALDMCALLLNIKDGDEVIMPSYTFVSTANAFALRGAEINFIDIKSDTMNIDESKIEPAITKNTKAIVVVHYAGISCDMDAVMALSKRYNIPVIEDAAQAVNCSYKGRALGSIGRLGAFSFHETKNYTCGEGGALIINEDNLIEKAEIIREKGTNRSKYFRGQVDKYTWVDLGSSYLPSEFNAAFLVAQLQEAERIDADRLATWKLYNGCLNELFLAGDIELPVVPSYAKHNGHMYYIKTKNIHVREKLIEYLKRNDIQSVFHYIPLHSSPAGAKYGKFVGIDENTTKESERLLRLPMWYRLGTRNVEKVVKCIYSFYGKKL